jgi:two-component system CheB/CheR fusion protein
MSAPRHRNKRSMNKKNNKATSAKKSKIPEAASSSPTSHQNSFPIVGIGASAGGLEAFSQLLSHLPLTTGMAFVLIQHLDPSHESMSTEILSRTTKMPVNEVHDGLRVEPNHVYVIPPNYEMAIIQGVLSLLPRTETRGQHMTIDFFFQSLAQDQKARAIGVVLSGTASDGAQGLKAIKAEGGLAMAQEPKSAKFDSMPRSAIASGIVDFILPPGEIAQELARIATHPYIAAACDGPQASADDLDDDKAQDQPDVSLKKIFALLRTRMMVDFSNYKYSTLKRRIQRRMMVQKTESLNDYARYLQDHPEEVKALFADLLIHVTEFFRDPESFKALTDQVFPSLLKKREGLAPIRVWVPGCASGEEAYSLAIVLIEFLGASGVGTPIQIFATDISEQAIQKARLGVYSEGIERSVSKDRLSRFFEKVDGGYKINKAIRELCLFSRHDVTCDPPFAKLDLVSCRNVLIYFAAVLQKRVIPTFHYALKPGGFLWLGRSEGPGELSRLFSVEDKTHKIYSKINIATPMTFQFPPTLYMPEIEGIAQKASVRVNVGPNFQRDVDQIANARFVPPGVVVNADWEILQFRGRTVPYLEPASGLTSNHLFKMARQELLPGLRIAVQLASKQNKPARKEGLSFEVDGKRREVNIEVIPANPLAPASKRNFAIFFQEVSSEQLAKKSKGSLNEKLGNKNGRNKKILEDQGKQNKHLEQELSASRQYQQFMTEEFEATKEELTSSNEELQSTNEELQSTNEEMETTKEELQSLNEELTTVNDELQNRNSELTVLGSDLNNLLVSVELPILFIGSDRRIRRFTPKAEKYFSLLPSDVGRPIGDIKPSFDLDLGALVSEVAESLAPDEKEIQDQSGRWKRIRVRPYKTTDNRIDGAVVAVMDIDDLKQRLSASDIALKYATSVADTIQLPFVVLDHDLRLKSANVSFFEYFQIPKQTGGGSLFDILGIRPENLPKLHTALTETLTSNDESKKFEITYEFPNIGLRRLLVSAKKIQWIESNSDAILVALDDITERKRIEEEFAQLLIREQEARAEAEKANQAKDLFLATLSHELRAPLTSILSWAQLLNMGKLDVEKSKQATKIIESSARAQGQLISDLLDVSRIIMGKLSMEMLEVDLVTVLHAAYEIVRPLAEEKSIQIKIELDPRVEKTFADPIRLQQVFWNLLTNAIKFSDKGSEIEVRLEQVTVDSKACAQIKVIDSGKGIPQDFLSHIFERFSQADNTCTRTYGGLGLGLAIVRNLIELQGGTVQADSQGEGKGSTFTITLPITTRALQLEAHDSPVKRRDPLARSIGENVDHPRLDGLRVLIVDDEESTRDAFALLLKSFGADARAAGSASEALVMFREFKPQVLVSDIGMPGEDGYSLIRKIRALGSKAGGDVPAIALTAYASSADVERAYSAGFQGHLAKPVESNDLRRMIAELATPHPGGGEPRRLDKSNI